MVISPIGLANEDIRDKSGMQLIHNHEEGLSIKHVKDWQVTAVSEPTEEHENPIHLMVPHILS